MKKINKQKKLAVIGLGYVGLPLGLEFGKKRSVIGFDVNETRINQLKNCIDVTLEATNKELKEATHLTYTTSIDDIEDCDIYIVTVPTPIDKFKNPDLKPLETACKALGSILKKDNIVIYESTVYPGATEVWTYV
jgi:UDP-N-acetyl-D-galactosamine dehydrogenase